MRARRQKFLSLEGLRGLLALLVCVGHLGLNTVANRVGINVRFGLSVDVFFALSGFVLAYSNFFGQRSLERYTIGRFARLYPLHLLTLLAMVGLFVAQRTPVDVPALVESVFLVQNVGLPPFHWGFNFPSWSISVEVWVSLVFFLLCRKRSRGLAIGACVLACVIGLAIPDLPDYDVGNKLLIVNLGMLRGIAGFGVGVAAYLTFERLAGAVGKLWQIAAYVGPVILAIVFCLPAWPMGTNVALYAVIFVTLIALARCDGNIWLSRPIFVGAGAISYSLYLLHIPVYTYLAAALGESAVRGTGKPLALLVVILLSMVAHKYFEMPFQAWLLRITRRETRSEPIIIRS